MNSELPSSPATISAASPGSSSSASYASVSSLPDGVQVGSLDNFSDKLDARGLDTITSYTATPRHKQVVSNDLRSRSWWRHTLKRSLIVILALLLLAGCIWGLKATVFRTKPEVTILPKAAPTDLPPSTNDLQNPGTISVNRELIVSGEAKFQQNISVQGNATLQKDLRVEGNGSVGGNLNISGNGSVQGNLNVVGDGNFTGTITAANFRGDGSQLTNIVATCNNCVHLQSKSPGTTETGSVSISGVLDAGSLQGSGVGITSINASNIVNGTLADARLSSNVPRLSDSNLFTGATNSLLGNVGIGNNNPNARLHVTGSVLVDGSSPVNGTDNAVGYVFGDSTVHRLVFGYIDPALTSNRTGYFKIAGTLNDSIQIGSPAGGLLALQTDANTGLGRQDRLLITATGNVGIGTSTPAARLDVAGSILQNGNVVCDASNNCGYAGGGSAAFVQGGNSFGALAVLGTNDSNDLAIRTNSVERLRVTAAGIVEVGPTNPYGITAKLTVNASGTGTGGISVIGDDFPNSSISFYNSTGTGNAGLGGIFGKASDSSLHVTTSYNFAPLILQENGGNVGIGTTNPGAKLDVAGYVRTAPSTGVLAGWDSGVYFKPGAGGGWSGFALQSQNANTRLDITEESLSTTIASFLSNGSVGIGTTTPAAGIKLDVFGNAQVGAGTGGWQLGFNATVFALVKPLDITSGSDGVPMYVRSGSATSGNANAGDLILSGGVGSGTGSDGNILFTTNAFNGIGNERMRITPAGNVGIGTINPQSQLQVQPTSISYGAVTMTAVSGSSTFITSSTVTLRAGDTIIPSATPTQARTVAATATGTTFTATFAFTANVSAQTFTTEGPVANFTNASGKSLLYVEGNGGNFGAVAIGSSKPTDKLSVVGINGFANNIGINRYGVNSGSALIFRAANGTEAAPTAITSNALLGEIDFRGAGTTAASLEDFNPAQIQSFSEQAFTDTSRGTRLTLSTTANNTTTPQERLRIDNTGNVGIGTTAPTQKLDVSVGAASNGQILLEGTDTLSSYSVNVQNGSGLSSFGTANNGDAFLKSGTAGKQLRLFSGDQSFITPELTLSNSKVGIGTTAPASTLDVYSSGHSSIRIMGVGDGPNFSSLNLSSDEAIDKSWVIAHRQLASELNKLITYYFNGVAYLPTTTIDTAGNFGIGTVNPQDLLDVNGGIRVATLNATAGATAVCRNASNQLSVCSGSGSGPALTLQDAYNNSSSPAAITTTSAAKTLLVKAGAGFDATNMFQVQNAASTPVLTVDTTNSQLNVRGINSNASLGSELIANTDFTTGGWTSTGWTTTAVTAMHTPGSINPLSTNQVSVVAGKIYQITFTVTGTPAAGETIRPVIGGSINGSLIRGDAASQVQLLYANTTGDLQFIPSSNWSGVISDVSVKLVTPSNAAINVLDDTGSIALEVRTSTQIFGGRSTFIGLDAGRSNTSGYYNTGVGHGALANNTTGGANIALGGGALGYNTTGNSNTAIGIVALANNTSGEFNTALGMNSLASNTNGIYNTAAGAFALQSTTGDANTGFGLSTLYANTIGTGNVAVGFGAGAQSTTGNNNVSLGYNAGATTVAANANVTGSNNTYVGYNAGPGTITQLQNATAIGTNAVVSQSDSLVLGCVTGVNGCANGTSVGIGTVAPLKSRLNVVDTQTATVSVPSNDDANYAQRIQGTVTDGYASPINNQYRGLDVEVTSTASNYLNVLNAQATITYNKQSGGTIGFQDGVNSDTRLDNAGNTLFGSGFRAIAILTSTGSLSNYNGLDVRTPVITSTGTIGTIHAVNIDPQTISGVGTAYGIYQSGSNDLNYFAGNVGIATTSPSAKLELGGSAPASGIYLRVLGTTNVNGATDYDAVSNNPNITGGGNAYARGAYYGLGVADTGAINYTNVLIGTASELYAGLLYGVSGSTPTAWSGTINSGIGASNAVVNSSSAAGAIMNAYGTMSAVANLGTSSIIQNAVGLDISAVQATGNDPSQTHTAYGIKIRDTITASGGATNNAYSLYNASAAPSYFAGNVGIGTNSPLAKLHIDGNGANDVRLQIDNANQPRISLNSIYPGSKQFSITNEGNANRLRFMTTDDAADSNPAYLMVMQGNGNVGIGTDAINTLNSVTAQFQVQGGTQSSGVTTMTASNGVTTFTTSTSITLNVGDYIVPTTSTGQARAVTIGGTGTSFTIFYPFTANVTGETFTIYRPTANFTNNAGISTLFVQGSTGSVGIGTTTPDAPLKVQFSDNFYARGLAIRNTNTGTNALVGVSLQDSNGVGKANFDYLPTTYGATNLQDTAAITSVGSSTRLAFISGADQPSLGGADIFFQSGVSNPNLIIKGATGNVGIGTTNPLYKLEVNTSTPDDQAVRAINTAATGSNFGGVFAATGIGATLNTGAYFNASGAGINQAIYIDTMPAGASNYAIYSPALAKSYFAGHIGIDTTTPGNLLSIGALTTTDTSGQIAVSTGGVNNKGMIIQAVAGQNADLLQAQDSTGAVLASIDKVGNLTVKNTTINGTLSVSGHIITANASGTTTIAAGAAACTTPTVTLSGNDTSGTITVITGSGCSSGGVLATISFATTYSTAPRVVVSADNANAAALQYYTSNRTTTTFDLATNTPPIDATTHTYNYQVLQ